MEENNCYDCIHHPVCKFVHARLTLSDKKMVSDLCKDIDCTYFKKQED